MGMLFDPLTGKVIDETTPEVTEDPFGVNPLRAPMEPDLANQTRGFLPGMEPSAIRSITRAPARIAAPLGDDEGEVFRGKPGFDPRDAQDGGWEPISSGDIAALARLGYRG